MTDLERIVALERRVADLEAQLHLLYELVGAQQPRRTGPVVPAHRHDLQVVEELRQGNLILAIKRYREVEGVDLRTAKEACERIMAELGLRK